MLVVIYLLIKRKHFFLEKKQQKYLPVRMEQK